MPKEGVAADLWLSEGKGVKTTYRVPVLVSVSLVGSGGQGRGCSAVVATVGAKDWGVPGGLVWQRSRRALAAAAGGGEARACTTCTCCACGVWLLRKVSGAAWERYGEAGSAGTPRGGRLRTAQHQRPSHVVWITSCTVRTFCASCGPASMARWSVKLRSCHLMFACAISCPRVALPHIASVR